MRQKLKYIWTDERTWKVRLGYAALMALALSFTFILYAVSSLYITNSANFPFYFREVFGQFFLLFLLAFALLTGCLFLLRGLVLDTMLSLMLGFLVAGYLQATFLNLPLGRLDGVAVPWQDYRGHALLNLLLWFVLLLLPLGLRYAARPLWGRFLVLIPLLLVALEAASLGMQVAEHPYILTESRPLTFLSTDGEYVVGEENTIVFVIDGMDSNETDAILAEEPAYAEALDGFTYFPDSVSRYWATFPSVTYMLTGLEYVEREYKTEDKNADPRQAYYQRAYGGSGFLDALAEAGYDTYLYIDQGDAYRDASVFGEKVVNTAAADASKLVLARGKIAGRMLVLVGYVYFPHCLKATFWMDDQYFDGTAFFSYGQTLYRNSQVQDFYKGLRTEGLTLLPLEKNFTFYHFYGAHMPYLYNKKLESVSPEETNGILQLKGHFTLVFDFLDQLRAMGLYEGANIILTGDHGRSWETWAGHDSPAPTPFFVKPAGAHGMPMQTSSAPVSHENLLPTLAWMAGLDASAYGRTVFEVDPAQREPRAYYDEKGTLQYLIEGDARDFETWKPMTQ